MLFVTKSNLSLQIEALDREKLNKSWDVPLSLYSLASSELFPAHFEYIWPSGVHPKSVEVRTLYFCSCFSSICEKFSRFAALLLMRVICFFEDGVTCFCLIRFCVAGDQRQKCSAVSPRFGIVQQNPWIYLPACSAWQGVSKEDMLTVVQVPQWQSTNCSRDLVMSSILRYFAYLAQFNTMRENVWLGKHWQKI